MTSHSTFRPTAAFFKIVVGVFSFCLIAGVSLQAQLIPIPPFSGAMVETFESYQTGFTNSPLPIMGGAATLFSATASVSISTVGFGFGLGFSSDNAPGSAAQPADGLRLLGIEDGSKPTTINIVFTNAVKAFGGYWGAGTVNSNASVLTFAFFDAADQQIGSTQTVSYARFSGDGLLEWHGWFSATPFKRVQVTSVSINTMVADSFRAGATGFSVFTSITPLNPAQIVLQGNGTTGVVYNVQANTNIATTNWTTVGTVQPDATGALRFTNSSTLPRRFFRLQAP